MVECLDAFLIEYSDSSFTNPHEVVRPDEPAECTGNFTHMGAKYWGYETLRHATWSRTVDGFQFEDARSHDFVIGLTHRSSVEEIRVSTKWFTGNQVPYVSIELIDGATTILVVERARLEPDSEQVFKVPATVASRCRVLCFHEGGIARVNLYGQPGEALYDRPNLLEQAEISYVSNDHYGSPAMAVAGQREQEYMIGWESARTGFGEQCVFSFEQSIKVSSLIVDTYLHRLNPPLSCHLFGLKTGDLDQAMKAQPRFSLVFSDGTEVVPKNPIEYWSSQSYLKENVSEPGKFEVKLKFPENCPWIPLVSFADLKPDTWHEISEIESTEPVSHLLYMHFPNGGVHGLKVFG